MKRPLERIFTALISAAIGALILITVVHCGPAFGQTVEPEWGVRISWDANPAYEEIVEYQVFWFDGDAGNWIQLAAVDASEALKFETRLSWIKSTLQVGNDLCFHIVAKKDDTVSAPSESACQTIEAFTSAVELSRPGAPVVEFVSTLP